MKENVIKQEMIKLTLSDLKDLRFFTEKDGTRDMLSMQLNCFETSVYNILLNQYKLDRKQVADLFIRDINPTCWINRTTGIYRMYNLSRNITPLWTKYVKVNSCVKEGDPESVKFIEELLNQGQMVILNTVFELISFYIRYNPDYDIKNFTPGVDDHFCLILHHDEEYFYYVEKIPYTVLMDNYVPYEYNNQIGVISKSEMAKATNIYMSCSTLEFRKEDLNGEEFKKDVEDLFKRMVDNFWAPAIQDGLYTRYYGRQAIEQFAGLCDEQFSLESYYNTAARLLLDRISYDIWMLHGSRAILLEYIKLKEDELDYSGDCELLLEKVVETKTQWEIVEKILNKKLRLREPLDSKLGDRIRRQLISETTLLEMLRGFYTAAS